ncbi:class I SAM-dependent methyltransferase [Mycobacterium sp. 1245111.1]|uniref:class I SAM-dependent methyltransferase n=1 Tax=Mycobacterium sp. 1245111.1 TaxID=1834073 RepID=UPI000ABF1F2E|nr:methyltransferase domain-containing protein [Mycobacterium sp. 1245111.1]
MRAKKVLVEGKGAWPRVIRPFLTRWTNRHGIDQEADAGGGLVDYRGYLDRFSILNRVVVFEGWANEADIEIYYDDTRLNVSLTSVKRPDLVPLFGNHAEDWGFAACATLPTSVIDRTKFKLRLNQGIPSVNNEIFSAASDKLFTQLVDTFRAAVALKPEPSLLEIGSRARSGNMYRAWFPEKLDYVGMDVHAGPNVDVVGDAHHLSRCVDRTFDFMFSISTFEHLLMPWKVALEMNKTLNDGGQALIISHPSWPLHDEPWDFFRFSKESWHGIFNVHTGFRVVDAQYQYPANIVPVYSNAPHFEGMSIEGTYLLSGCIVEKTGPPQVAWEAEASAIYNLNYSHA